MRYSLNRVILIPLISLCLLTHFACSRNNNQEKQIINWKKAIHRYQLPRNAIELDIAFSFPDESSANKDIYFSKVQRMISNENSIYVSDVLSNRILHFDFSGKFVRTFGKTGQGPGELIRPIFPGIYGDNMIFVFNDGNRRIEYFDTHGNYVKSTSIFKAYTSIVSDEKGEIFATPALRRTAGKYLVDGMNDKYEVIKSFCAPENFNYYSGVLNDAGLLMGDNEELIIFWRPLAKIQRYTTEGDFINEISVKHSMKIVDCEKKNRTLGYEGGPGRFWIVVQSAAIYKGHLYLLTYFPRIEILELNLQGNLINYYWAKQAYNEIYSDILVREIDGRKKFYVLEVFPENRIHVFSEKTN